MKKIKSVRRWGVYQLNAKEVEEYGFKYAPVHPETMEAYEGMLDPSDADWECDTLQQCIDWITNYEKEA